MPPQTKNLEDKRMQIFTTTDVNIMQKIKFIIYFYYYKLSFVMIILNVTIIKNIILLIIYPPSLSVYGFVLWFNSTYCKV